MCFAPSFLRSRGGALTRITESSYCRRWDPIPLPSVGNVFLDSGALSLDVA